MTMITIDNLNDGIELDQEHALELRGGVRGAPVTYVQNLLQSYDLNEYRIGGVDFVNAASNGSIANVSGLTLTDVIGSINFTVLQG